MSRQEVFDICTTIILVAVILALGVWLAVDYTEKPCKYVSPYKNTIQHDMNMKIECTPQRNR